MATWADSNYKFRIPVAVAVFPVGGGGATNIDIEVSIPPDWDTFWNNIRSDMFDIQIYSADSSTNINYQRQSGANYSDRNLTLDIEQAAIDTQDATHLIWLYFGYSSQSTDPTTAFTVSSPYDGIIWLGRPQNVVKSAANQIGRESPNSVFSKGSGAKVDIWFDVRTYLSAYLDPYNGRLGYEGIKYVKPKSLASDGTNSDSRYSDVDTYFVAGYASIRTIAGSSGTDYAIGLDVITTNGQTHELRALLKVQDLLPQ